MDQVFAWKSGFRSQHISAAAAGEVCSRLEEQGRLTAADLVKESESSDAPLHSYFEWDNNVAGDEWRKQQARVLISSIVITPIVEQKEVTIRAFHNVLTTSPQYKNISSILESREDCDALLQMAKRELISFRSKYSKLTKLSSVMAEIDKVIA